MSFLFGGGGHKSSPTPAPVAAPTPTQANGAAQGATTQNYNGGNVLSNQAAVSRGSFLGS
jgi:hypothetical protein